MQNSPVRSNIWPRVLQEAGVKPGQTVASILWTRKHLAVVLLALARLGAINVPLDPALPEKRLRSIIDDAGPVMILSDDPEACADFPTAMHRHRRRDRKNLHCELPRGPEGNPLDPLHLRLHRHPQRRDDGSRRSAPMKRAASQGWPGSSRATVCCNSHRPGFDASLEELLATLLSGATLGAAPRGPGRGSGRSSRTSSAKPDITVLDLTTAHWAAWCAWMVAEKETVPDNVRDHHHRRRTRVRRRRQGLVHRRWTTAPSHQYLRSHRGLHRRHRRADRRRLERTRRSGDRPPAARSVRAGGRRDGTRPAPRGRGRTLARRHLRGCGLLATTGPNGRRLSLHRRPVVVSHRRSRLPG